MSYNYDLIYDFSDLLFPDFERIFENDTKWKRQDLMALHRTICDMCCNVSIERTRSQGGGRVVYNNITNFLTIRLKSIVAELDSINDEQKLVREYGKSWKSYQASVTVLDIGCSYLNENWVKKERLDDVLDYVYTIYHLAMIMWNKFIFRPIDRSLINAIEYTMVMESHAPPASSMIYTVLQSIVDIFANDDNQSYSVLEKMNNEVLQPVVLKFFEDKSKTLFKYMLESDSCKELKHFVKCAILYKPSIEPDLCRILSEYLECLLKNAIDRCGSSNYGRDYVQAILALRKVPPLRALAHRKELLAVADLVCVKVINDRNQVENPPKILALYCHKLIQKKPLSETLTNELKRIVDVVAFLNDDSKTFFTKLYFALLNKRRIDNISASDENESLMISMLGKNLGTDFLSRATIDRNEMAASSAIQAKCKDFMLGIGLKVQIDVRIKFFKVRELSVLSNSMRLPVELEQPVNELKLFWSKQYNRYALDFNLPKSWGELTMNLSAYKCYTLQVNTLQMALLLQFNHQNIFAVQKLAENVGASPETLIMAMRPLIDRKLLIAGEDSAALTPTSSITVCSDYNSKKSLINIVMATAPRVTETNTRILVPQELDAAIVRIMKREKQLHLSQLMFKVTQEPNLRSSPIKLIKGRIEHFLENKYLELSSDKKVLKLSKCTEDS
ncbi:cullin homolog 1 [Drosophila obscura]|uniref:cullin homolog 1 n=1 Tax=Drosophila obscura TaxID=7282 RepID=UPI001BB1978F|nr:cullin homolog 1 [Drosophila obscura]